MTVRADFPDEPPAGADALAPLLGDDAVWADPDPGLEDAVVHAVAAGAGASRPAPSATTRSALGRWLAPVAVGVAAAVVVLVAASLIGGDADREPAGVAVALAGTELAPDASAVAAVADTPLGTRIDLDVTGLPPAGEDEYYEGWLWDADGDAVSAGSFHLRGGDGTIELWAGVGLAEYPRMTVTREAEDDGPEPSGEVVLRG